MTTTATAVLSDRQKHYLPYKSLRGYCTNVYLHLNLEEEGQFPGFPLTIDGRPLAVQRLIHLYLPRGFADNGSNDLLPCYGWLLEITDLTGASHSLDIALHSLYMSQLYATGCDTAPLETCLDIYDTALQKLRADLEDPEAKLRDETLAAIVIISTNEVRNLVGNLSYICS
jgi:hypothetical protein